MHRRTQEIFVIGNRAVEHGLRVRGEHDVVVLARPDRLLHGKHVHVREDLGERGNLIAQEGEVPAIIARNHVHGVDAAGRKAALHGPGRFHRSKRADRFLAGKGVVHDSVEAAHAAGSGFPLLRAPVCG